MQIVQDATQARSDSQQQRRAVIKLWVTRFFYSFLAMAAFDLVVYLISPQAGGVLLFGEAISLIPLLCIASVVGGIAWVIMVFVGIIGAGVHVGVRSAQTPRRQ